MYEIIISIISTLILISPPIFIKYLTNNMMSIIKFYICMINLVKLELEM
ncbi:hypothetical protein [Paraclostridium bifermentans]